jgi:hypothetical protein
MILRKRNRMFHVPNQYRIRNHPLYGSDENYGNNGAFSLIHDGYEFKIIASDGLGWEHVSVTINRNRCPSWEQMCFIKSIFWDPEDCVIQFHPPQSQYVNNHSYCLHLWRSTIYQTVTPDPILVGYK